MSASVDGLGLRPDFERLRAWRGETRTGDRLAAHFAVERRLAARLAASGPNERSSLYAEVYRELFASVSDHPQHSGDRAMRLDRIAGQVAWLRRMLTPAATYAEIGCGDAALTKALAPHVAHAIGIDVTGELVVGDAPSSFSFLQTDGTSFDLPSSSVDLVYSNQLMEHLHVEDAGRQLAEIARIIKPGGQYVCTTPNRLTGPHDISVYFGMEPAGFHLREYDHRTLSAAFREAGFRRLTASVTVKGQTIECPASLAGAAETLVELLPGALRRRLLQHRLACNLLGLTLIGTR